MAEFGLFGLGVMGQVRMDAGFERVNGFEQPSHASSISDIGFVFVGRTLA
jgi:hypothetical protein